MNPKDREKPPNEYGPWKRGNAGQVGRCVTTWVETIFHVPGMSKWLPVVDWEPHPDEGGGRESQ